MNAYSSTCGVKRGKNISNISAKAMMGENSLTFIPFDDPSKEVFEGVIENGYDGSNVAKLKGIA